MKVIPLETCNCTLVNLFLSVQNDCVLYCRLFIISLDGQFITLSTGPTSLLAFLKRRGFANGLASGAGSESSDSTVPFLFFFVFVAACLIFSPISVLKFIIQTNVLLSGVCNQRGVN